MRNRSTAAALVVTFFVAVSGCGDTKIIAGVEYDTYGLINKDEVRNPEIQYETIWGNVILGVILIETIIAPIYFFGFSLFEPVGKKPVPEKGQAT